MIQEACLPGRCVSCGVGFEPPNHTEVNMSLSNNSTMRLGVCMACKDSIFYEDKEALWKAVLKGWELESKRKGHKPAQTEAILSQYRGVSIL